MLYCEVVFPVVRQTLVERRVLLLGDFSRVASPERLGLVQLLVLDFLLFDRLLFLLFILLFVLDLLDLRLVLLLLLLFNFLLVFDLLRG